MAKKLVIGLCVAQAAELVQKGWYCRFAYDANQAVDAEYAERLQGVS